MDAASPSTRHFEDPPFVDRSVEETENLERDMTWNQSNSMIYNAVLHKLKKTCFFFASLKNLKKHEFHFLKA